MKTKLITLSAIFILATFTLQAQIGFGILGGINFQNLNGKDSNGDKLTNDMMIGYHAGINVQIPVAPEFYFQPGLLFATKGAKNYIGTTTTRISYIELPLNLVYKGKLGMGSVMLGLGPYVGYAIGGKGITFQKVVETTDPDPLSNPYFKRFDAGGNIFAGYEMAGGLFFQLDAQMGMIKINPENKRITNDKTAVKNTGFGLSLGYRF